MCTFWEQRASDFRRFFAVFFESDATSEAPIKPQRPLCYWVHRNIQIWGSEVACRTSEPQVLIDFDFFGFTAVWSLTCLFRFPAWGVSKSHKSHLLTLFCVLCFLMWFLNFCTPLPLSPHWAHSKGFFCVHSILMQSQFDIVHKIFSTVIAQKLISFHFTDFVQLIKTLNHFQVLLFTC